MANMVRIDGVNNPIKGLALSRSQFDFFTVGVELEVIHYALVHLVNPFNYQHKEKKG